MAPPTRPTKPGAKPAAAKKPGPKPAAAAAEDAPKPAAKKRNMRPKMPVFWEDTEAETLMDLGAHLGNTAEEALGTYLASLDEADRETAFAAETYAVVAPDEGLVRLTIVPPTEPTIARR